MRNILLVILIPFFSFSQNTRKLFVEIGTTINSPFQKYEFNSYKNYQSSTSYYSKLYNTTGSYTKLGIDMKPEKGKRFYVTVPLFIAYKEFIQKIVTEFLISDIVSTHNFTQELKATSKSITLSIGPKFNFETKRIIYFGSINLNADIEFMNSSVINFKDESGTQHASTYKATSKDLMYSSSLQIGVSYKISEKWEIGVSGESYFYNFNPLIYGDKENNKVFNTGYGDRSSIFCAGVRGSYNF